MSIRVTTPRSCPSSATGRSFILSSAMIVAASERESSGETVFTSNLADHNRAIEQWQAWCTENPDSGC